MAEARLRHRAAAGLLLILALAPPGLEAVGEGYFVSVLTRIVIYAIAAVSLDFILGFGGLVSLGHAGFLGIGAYVAAILSMHAFEETAGLFGIPGTNEALIAWPAAMLAAAAVAAFIGWISLRTRGVYFIMITLAFGQMLFFLFVSLERYGGDDGLSLWWGRNTLGPVSLDDQTSFFYVCLALLAGVYLLFARIVAMPFGQVLVAAMQNETRVRAIGFAPFRYRLIAFTLSGAVAGLAGALAANQSAFVSPALMHWTKSGEILVMVLLGGIGTLWGAVAGSAALLLLEELLIPLTEYWQLVLGPILVAIVLFARRGLAGVAGAAGGGR